MFESLIKLYEAANLSGATPGVIYLPVLDTRTLTIVKVKTDENTAGDAVFALKKNGAVISGAGAITIASGTKIGTVSSLEIALTEGDELVLDLVSGNVSSPITLDILTTRTVGTDEITEVTNKKYVTDAEKVKLANTSGVNSGDQPDATLFEFGVACSDETTALAILVAAATLHVMRSFTLVSIFAGLTANSTSGLVTVNIKKNGTTIFSTKITIDANEATSLTAAAPYALTTSPTTFVQGDAISVDIDAAGTGAKGLKVYFLGTRA